MAVGAEGRARAEVLGEVRVLPDFRGFGASAREIYLSKILIIVA
jgi:hypothetical protein